MRLRCGDDVHTVEVRATASGVEVTVDGTALAAAVERLGPGTFLWSEGTRQEPFHCAREGGRIHLFWRGAVYVLEEVAEGARRVQRHAAQGLEAPMPGKVIAVKVEPGQTVSRGDEILVVEAMKMENAIRAPRDGVVKSVRASVGDMVSPGVVLVELEE
ncbi:MAG TPA: biotin/lipoyl-containing protein [Vicinamibacteria bacterium]|nr:biotin/lipoyl-containing protein [Vicinamibacteria bacterium]